MRKKEIEAKLDKLAKDGQSLWEYAFRPPPDSASAVEVAGLRKEIKDLRDLLDEVIEPGYVLSKKADRGLNQASYRFLDGLFPSRSYDFYAYRPNAFDTLLSATGKYAKSESKPTSGTYEIRRRISNELVATFAEREDADIFIEALDGVLVDETGEVTE